VPAPLRSKLANALTSVPPERWDDVFARFRSVLPAIRLPGYKVHKLARILGSASRDDLYTRLASTWIEPDIVAGGPPSTISRLSGSGLGGSFAERMMLADLTGYLPDDILTKVDRASMAVSLEARVPLIDHRVVELAWRMPLRFKIRRGVGKRLVRSVLYRHVPQALVDRPKMGFGVPVGEWLRGSLREWAESLLTPTLVRDAALDPALVGRAWRSHQSGAENLDQHLWTVLMYMAWLEHRAAKRQATAERAHG
jgi:asparagine synthase (glutamine-hydrolysing)